MHFFERRGAGGKGERNMGEWKCSNCGYVVQADVPPEQCPSCKEKCEFVDVSCYIPDCGNTGKDPRL
jgi:rubrerythrin